MTDLEIMQHAKEYLDKLARGIDPLTGREVPEGEIINNVRISRCLFYVSDVLRQVIENGGIQVKSVKSSEKAPFALSFEDLRRLARHSERDRPAAQRTGGSEHHAEAEDHQHHRLPDAVRPAL